MIQRIIKTNDLNVHLIAFKAIILGIIQYGSSVLGIMSGAQRKKLEAIQKLILSWIFKRCKFEKSFENDAILLLVKETEDAAEEIDNFAEIEDHMSYKDKLREADLFPTDLRPKRSNSSGSNANEKKNNLQHYLLHRPQVSEIKPQKNLNQLNLLLLNWENLKTL